MSWAPSCLLGVHIYIIIYYHYLWQEDDNLAIFVATVALFCCSPTLIKNKLVFKLQAEQSLYSTSPCPGILNSLLTLSWPSLIWDCSPCPLANATHIHWFLGPVSFLGLHFLNNSLLHSNFSISFLFMCLSFLGSVFPHLAFISSAYNPNIFLDLQPLPIFIFSNTFKPVFLSCQSWAVGLSASPSFHPTFSYFQFSLLILHRKASDLSLALLASESDSFFLHIA